MTTQKMAQRITLKRIKMQIQTKTKVQTIQSRIQMIKKIHMLI